MNITPSRTTVSDLLNSIHACQEAIESALLIGEKVSMIQETAILYNELKSLISPEYLTDDEYEWIQKVANSWNEDMSDYQKSHQGDSPQTQEDIGNMLNDMIDDIMDGFEPPQDNGGFDGGDGIY